MKAWVQKLKEKAPKVVLSPTAATIGPPVASVWKVEDKVPTSLKQLLDKLDEKTGGGGDVDDDDVSGQAYQALSLLEMAGFEVTQVKVNMLGGLIEVDLSMTIDTDETGCVAALTDVQEWWIFNKGE